MYSSSGSVMRTVSVCLARRKCRILGTCSNSRTVGMLGDGRISLLVVSIVVPQLSKVQTALGVQRGVDLPVVVLSTGSRSTSGVLKLGVNTSSCVAGPFGPLRLMTEMGSRLEHCARLKDATESSGRDRFQAKKLIVESSLGRIAISNRGIGLAPVRCGVLLLLIGGRKGIFSVGRVCRGV